MNLKISVVIPLYNVAEYADKAAKSIKSQAFAGLEIVLVDDGSTDDSLERYAECLDGLNVVKLSQSNSGPGGARNTGIKNASGEYIAFLDADDFFLPNAFSNIRSALENDNPDVLFGRFHLWTADKGLVRTKSPSKPPPADTRSQAEYILGGQREAAWCPVRYIFKRAFVLKHKVFFSEQMLCEDVKWVVDLLMAVEKHEGKISFLQEPFYAYYNRRPGSTMNTYSVKRLEDLNSIVTELIKKYPDRLVICRALVWESFYYINEYCLFGKTDRMQILECYKQVLPRYRVADLWIIRQTSKLRHPTVFLALSLALYITKMARRCLLDLVWYLRFMHPKRKEQVY